MSTPVQIRNSKEGFESQAERKVPSAGSSIAMHSGTMPRVGGTCRFPFWAKGHTSPYGWVALVIFLMGLTSCASGKLHLANPAQAVAPEPPSEHIYSLFVIGDAGLLNAQQKSVVMSVAGELEAVRHPNSVIFVGDNIYPAGLADPEDGPAYQDGVRLLTYQIEKLRSRTDRMIYMPGNHDWNEFKPGGLEAIRRQDRFLAGFSDPGIDLLPDAGCGGPAIVELSDQIVLFILDSQWWIQDWSGEIGMNEGCPYSTREGVIQALRDALMAHQGKRILIATHHPLYANGTHGGRFTVRDHLFPLSKVVKWLYLPLPGLGSIYPLYRGILGHPQDLANPKYKSLRKALLPLTADLQDVIFLAGHDHNLQYLRSDGHHFLLSGAGAKQNAVGRSRKLHYGHRAAGYMRLDIRPEGAVWLTISEVDPESGNAEVVYRQEICPDR